MSDILKGYMEEHVSKNTEAELANLDHPDYGLVPNMPIYTMGTFGSRRYLFGLTTAKGKIVLWERRGSTIVEGINGPVDIYDGTLKSGERYGTIFINMYGSKISEHLPRGYMRKFV